MSGGVDSSVSAALLKQATPNNFEKLFGRPTPKGFRGYDVTGVFIKVWQPDFIECTWKEDRLDAMRVAAGLGIPFVTLDLEKEYKQGVIDYMIEEYRIGRTPNPDVMCNREVKFGAFWRWAKEQGADYIATGHYASTDNTHLLLPKDIHKDQTYFLWTLTQDDLEHVLFPIGHMEKENVRKEAQSRNLYTSTKKDSQGLCFIGTIDLKTLLKEYIKEEAGGVVDEAGETIGGHAGVMFYTIGERHGFTITKKGTDDAAFYVIGKDIEKNILIVSHEKPQTSTSQEIVLERVSFVNEVPEQEVIYNARGRYRAPLAKVKMLEDKNTWKVHVVEGELIHTSGQSLVLYDDMKCLGGGIMQ